MAWVTGTATDYLDLLDQLIEVATSQHLATVAVSAGGTGYSVGDIVTLVGGTSSHAAKAEVLTVSGGVVTSIQVDEGGAYTSTPGNPVSTSGAGNDDLTVTATWANTGWTVKRRTQEAASATVAAGGSGYSVNDKLTLLTEDSVGEGVASVFNVDTVSSGAVTAVSLDTAGDYEEVHSSTADIATSVAPAGGSGCELNVTFQDAPTQEGIVILEGTGGGSDNILVGIRTYNVAAENGFDTSRNWTLAGFTGFNSGLVYNGQPGIGPTEGNPASSSGGAYVTLKDSSGTNISFWFTIDSFRIAGVAKCTDGVETHYLSWYLGFLNRFATANELPYPIYIAGSTSRHNAYFTDTESGRLSGLTECIRVTALDGPAWFLRTDSVWQEAQNSSVSDTGAPARSRTIDYTIYPCGQTDNSIPAVADQIVLDSDIDWDNIIPPTGVPGSPTVQLKKTPNSGGDLNPLWPATLVMSDGSNLDIQGELDGIFWVSAANGEASEDRLLIGNDRYHIFQNGNRTTVFSFMAIKQG